MIELTRQFGRYGYCQLATVKRNADWHVNEKRVERLWVREGLKVPFKQPNKGRLWQTTGRTRLSLGIAIMPGHTTFCMTGRTITWPLGHRAS